MRVQRLAKRRHRTDAFGGTCLGEIGNRLLAGHGRACYPTDCHRLLPWSDLSVRAPEHCFGCSKSGRTGFSLRLARRLVEVVASFANLSHGLGSIMRHVDFALPWVERDKCVFSTSNVFPECPAVFIFHRTYQTVTVHRRSRSESCNTAQWFEERFQNMAVRCDGAHPANLSLDELPQNMA